MLSLRWNYAERVKEAGGNPVLLTPLTDPEEISGMLDGWLIPGGDDMDAKNFGQANHPEVTLADPSRFEFEKRLWDVIDPEMPVLGICYGCQFVNVARGGSLHQHIPEFLGHDQHSGGTLGHNEIDPNSELAIATKCTSIIGKSYHHQAVDKLGAGLKITARSQDGIIEAIEDPDHPFLVATQWHPERTPDDQATLNLFRTFVAKASEFRERKNHGGGDF
jgi:gamma-glutamyl-gamma-aminobutyrate hydrolase PuuD